MHSKIAAIVGGGVIGGGWAARFLLNGWDVRVFDPDPQTGHKIHEVLANARRSLPGLYNTALPKEGKLTLTDSIEDAVNAACWIQESVPERLSIKHLTYAQIQAVAPRDAVLASSTSGFKPSELAKNARYPEQILVAHPYNPVYLLPLVELVQHADSKPHIVDNAIAIARSIDMRPVLIKREIDAHIGDRLLEALWREALWLVRDDYATTTEIDDIIRYGFGLRWAQMGLFETYRVAGGVAGMEHFIAQFAPALKWPWSKLMDVPEFDDTLIKKIAGQSDEQSGHHTIRELERLRDNNLVGIMRALKKQNWGVGQLLVQRDSQMTSALEAIDWSQPVATAQRIVPLDWSDHNGHMNETHYLEVFSKACDRMLALLGCDAAYIEAGYSYFTVENIVQHLGEVHTGEQISVHTQIVYGEGKKLHLYHELLDANGTKLATGEQMLLHVCLKTRKTTLPIEPLAGTLQMAAYRQAVIPKPKGLKAGKTSTLPILEKGSALEG